ncbi:MAG TPA: hypothetical protein VMS12_05075, partial [Thermoanaerobaculia bacterium]|nr:hypothetical protein [Thermoanaerobaculia bacterium]
LDLMNVKYIFSNEWVERRQPSNALPGVDLLKSDGPAHLFRRASALERIFLVPASAAEVVATDAEALERVLSPSFEPRNEVIVTGLPSQLQLQAIPQANGETVRMRVISIQRGADAFTAQVETSVPAIAVFSDIHYPGWKARVNGRPAELLLADYAFKAVLVPPGSSVVTFMYDPASFKVGLVTSLAALSILILLTTIEVRRRRALQPDPLKSQAATERRPRRRRQKH